MNGIRGVTVTPANTPTSQQGTEDRGIAINSGDPDNSSFRSHDAFDSSSSSGNTSDEEDDDEDSCADGELRRQTNDSDSPENVSFKNVLKSITIEPMMFAHMFAYTTTSVVVQNLYIERICKVSLKYNDTICGHLDIHEHIENEIDEIAAKFVTYRSLIEAGFPIIFSLFLGPWTDIHGTKWPMLLPMMGYCFSSLSYLILSQFPHAPPELLLISSFPVSIVGGLVALIMSAFSFVAKQTNMDNRSFRVAMVEASWFLGGPIGILTGGVLYKYGGFTAVFSTSATVFLLAFIYGSVVLKEDLPEIEDRESRSIIGDMFNVKAVKDMFGTVFLRRNGLQRRWLLTMLFAISLRIFALFGYLQNMYLYTRKKLGWGLQDYTEYSVSDSFIQISGGYVMIMTLMKIFQLPDAVIGILSTIGPILSQFVFAFAVKGCGWMLYLGSSFQMFAGLISIVLRAMISKIVAKEEIARVYTFLACSEASMPLIGVPLYSYIFRHTLTTFPGTMFMVSAGGYFIILLCFIYLFVSMRRSTNHVQMDESVDD